MDTFIIKNPAYQEHFTVEWVRKNVIFACPYDGPEDREWEFREQVSTFFWHIVHCTLYNSKFKNVKRLPSIPFAWVFGIQKLPMVFGSAGSHGSSSRYSEKSRTKFSRALEWLKENVLDVSGYKFGAAGSACREFRIKRAIFDGMYPYSPKTPEEIFGKVRYCSPNFLRNTPVGKTLADILQKKSVEALGKPSHDFDSLDRNRDREVRKLYKDVLDKQDPLSITLLPVVEELSRLSKFTSAQAKARHRLVFSNTMGILAGNFTCHSVDEMKISYLPTYRVSPVGGRLYECGGGFQNFPRSLKERCHIRGYNHDMRSSQLNILKMEFERNNIRCSSIQNYKSVADFGEPYGLSKDDTKVCFYATVFSIGQALNAKSCWHSEPLRVIAKSKRTECIHRAAKQLGKKYRDSSMIEPVIKLARKLMVKETNRIRDVWNKENETLTLALEELCEKYISKARKAKENSVLTNAVGVRFAWPTEEIDYKIRKQILSHMITGIETKLLFDMILSNGVRVYSFEHDGALISRAKVSSEGIEFVRKPFDETSYQYFKNL